MRATRGNDGRSTRCACGQTLERGFNHRNLRHCNAFAHNSASAQFEESRGAQAHVVAVRLWFLSGILKNILRYSEVFKHYYC